MQILHILRAPSWGLMWATFLTSTLSATTDFFSTADGTRYAYNFIPAQGLNRTFLFLHGYPSTSQDWKHQIATLSAEGFGILAPDMLGFGASDLPVDDTSYRAKRLSDHIVELLDHTGLDTVIGVGHDWGTVVLSRTVAWYQHRFDKIVLMNGMYTAPGGFVDIDAFNAQGFVESGYTWFGYWYFFTRYDASTIMMNHVSCIFTKC
jgi:soluble epoxide hydrolase / lipid-phosphate phosphatase